MDTPPVSWWRDTAAARWCGCQGWQEWDLENWKSFMDSPHNYHIPIRLFLQYHSTHGRLPLRRLPQLGTRRRKGTGVRPCCSVPALDPLARIHRVSSVVVQGGGHPYPLLSINKSHASWFSGKAISAGVHFLSNTTWVVVLYIRINPSNIVVCSPQVKCSSSLV